MLSVERARCDDLFRSLERSRHLLLAVSGGPDSTALLVLIDAWRHGRNIAVSVATVDHGLREGSAAEATAVARLCAARSFPHHVLVRTGAPFLTRIQERARKARYDLLLACANRIGADTLVTGHHADDQAETILMRLARGSGLAGLSGMAHVSSRAGVRLARPLLASRKTDLIAICAEAGLAPAHDPANCDPAFFRTRLRALAPVLDEQGLDTGTLIRFGSRAARADAALDWALDQVLLTGSYVADPDRSFLPAQAFLALPEELRVRFVGREIVRLVPGLPLRLARLEALVERLSHACLAQTAFAATLGGAKIDVTGSHLRITLAPPRRDTDARRDPYPYRPLCLGKAAVDA